MAKSLEYFLHLGKVESRAASLFFPLLHLSSKCHHLSKKRQSAFVGTTMKLALLNGNSIAIFQDVPVLLFSVHLRVPLSFFLSFWQTGRQCLPISAKATSPFTTQLHRLKTCIWNVMWNSVNSNDSRQVGSNPDTAFFTLLSCGYQCFNILHYSVMSVVASFVLVC